VQTMYALLTTVRLKRS